MTPFPPQFPSDSALTLAKLLRAGDPQRHRREITNAAWDLAGYAAGQVLGEDEADEHNLVRTAAEAPAEGEAAPPPRRRHRKSDDAGFSVNEPGPILDALEAQGKATVKEGGSTPLRAGLLTIPAMILLKFALKLLKEYLD